MLLIDHHVVLIRNERNEWDLPGGKLKRKEELAVCLRREIKEELAIDVEVQNLLNTTTVKVMNIVSVLVVIYHCQTTASLEQLQQGQENFGIGLFTIDEVSKVDLPKTYQIAIAKSFATIFDKE